MSQATGLLLSGFLISRFQFTARQLAGWNTLTGLIHMFVMFSFVSLGCDGGDFSFGTKHDNGTFDLTLPCNTNCHCHTNKILPVCYKETNTVFYSACHAGCEVYNEMNQSSTHCACLPNPNDTVSVGNCGESCSHIFLIFLGVNALIKFVDSTGRIGNMLISYR